MLCPQPSNHSKTLILSFIVYTVRKEGGDDTRRRLVMYVHLVNKVY